jgi:hypothetical protein
MKNSVLFFAVVSIAGAQAPTGSIAGLVRDPSGAGVTGAHVEAVSLATGLARTEVTPEQGEYSFPALPAGSYEVRVETPGFRRVLRQAPILGAGGLGPTRKEWKNGGGIWSAQQPRDAGVRIGRPRAFQLAMRASF